MSGVVAVSRTGTNCEFLPKINEEFKKWNRNWIIKKCRLISFFSWNNGATDFCTCCCLMKPSPYVESRNQSTLSPSSTSPSHRLQVVLSLDYRPHPRGHWNINPAARPSGTCARKMYKALFQMNRLSQRILEFCLASRIKTRGLHLQAEVNIDLKLELHRFLKTALSRK